MFSHDNPHPAHADKLRAVHSESRYRCPACGRQADDRRGGFVPREMIEPPLALRMEQLYAFLRGWGWSHSTVRFEPIACWTGQAEVFKDRCTAHRARNDMFELEDGNG